MEYELINDIWDVLMMNDNFCTQEQFMQKYGEMFVEVDSDTKSIRIATEHAEYQLTLQKVWSDGKEN